MGLFVEVVQHHLADRAAFEFHHHADAVLVGFIPQVADALNLLFVHQRSNLFDQGGLVERIGDLRDDDPLAIRLPFLNLGFATQLEEAPPSLVHRADGSPPAQGTPGRKVRALHEGHQVRDSRLGVVDQMDNAINDLAGIMWRNVRGHAHRNTCRSVDQQIGQPRRQHLGFLQLFIVVGLHIDRVFVEICQQLLRRPLQATLGIAVGRRRVAINATEIALPIDQQTAGRKLLGHAHQSVIDR